MVAIPIWHRCIPLVVSTFCQFPPFQPPFTRYCCVTIKKMLCWWQNVKYLTFIWLVFALHFSFCGISKKTLFHSVLEVLSVLHHCRHGKETSWSYVTIEPFHNVRGNLSITSTTNIVTDGPQFWVYDGKVLQGKRVRFRLFFMKALCILTYGVIPASHISCFESPPRWCLAKLLVTWNKQNL